MYTIYKQGFLFIRVNDNWEEKHLVLNGNPSCRTFHQIYHGTHLNLFDLCLNWNGVQSWMELEWNGIQSWGVGVDSTQMHQHLFDEHGQVQFILNLNILFWGLTKFYLYFLLPPPLKNCPLG